MFTGIIDHCGKIIAITRLPGRTVLLIETNFEDLEIGESIAVDGVCLTVTDLKKGRIFACDLSEETLTVSIAAQYTVGDSVNLERALKLNSRINGHLVTGHVDQTIRVIACEDQGEFKEIHFSVPANPLAFYIIPKGSVAINGVSLTINTVTAAGFSVALIPHTLEKTGLQYLTAGTTVNIEFDLVTKIISHHAHVIFKSMEQPTYEDTLH